MTANVVLQSGESSGSATINEINAEAVNSANTKTREAVAIENKEIQFKGNAISYSFPAHSFTQVLIPVK
jgi:alpha-N-arabinofuranosidase